MATAVRSWGTTKSGQEAHLYSLAAPGGARADISTYGACLVSLWVPVPDGQPRDVLLGFDNLAAYEEHDAYFGFTVGRTCNRIGGARFTLDGVEYKLPVNNGPNCLHGGVGFSHRVWEVLEVSESSITLQYIAADMEDGFPGRLVTKVQYVLSAPADGEAAIEIRYHCETDKPTVVNLTNHAYFNFLGHTEGTPLPDILNHTLCIRADRFTAADEQSITTGELVNVEGTPLDFRTTRPIGESINSDFEQMRLAKGYDHNFVLPPTKVPGTGCHGARALGLGRDAQGRLVKEREADCVAQEPTSKITMEVYTTEPAVQLYTANYLCSKGPAGKYGVGPYGYRTGFCLETQHFPDSPNKECLLEADGSQRFPSTRLDPGQVMHTETVYWFSVAK